MRVPAPPATTVRQTWKGPQAAQRLGVLFGREGVPSGPAQGGACEVVSRPVPGGGAVGYCVPFGWSGLFRCLGTQRPGGPACPAGSPFLPRNGEKEGRGQAPWTPGFYGRSFPLAGFWGRCLWYGRGAMTTGILTPIWNAFSRKNMLKKHFCERTFPPRCVSTPQAFPLGGRCPSAHTGADEGAIWYPTFPCRKKAFSRLSPQRNFSFVPLGNPVAPSSVTFGDSFPPRGSLWAVQPYTKKASQIRVHTWGS